MNFDFTKETTNHFKEIKFEWRIKNFSKLTDKVEGPPFLPMTDYLFRWQVVLKLGVNTNGYYCFIISLKSLDSEGSTPPLKVVGNISLRNSERVLWDEQNFDVIIKAGASVQCWNMSGLNYELPSSISRIFILCNDDVFVMEWSMTVSGIITSIITPISHMPVVKKNDEDTCNAFKTMYQKKIFTDVTFHIGKQTITSHKAVLSARSAVFEKMFEHDTLEKQTSSITINDFDYQIFDSFIEFVYTKEVSNMKDDLNSLLALYEVADKYAVFDLQRYCAFILLSRFLNVNDVVRIIETADTHSDKYLKELAMEFIRHRFSEVAATTNWSQLIKSNVELASNIVSYVTTFVERKK